MNQTSTRTFYVGEDSNNEHHWLTVTLSEHEADRMTVNHDKITNYTRVSICGETNRYRTKSDRGFLSGGQNFDSIMESEIVEPGDIGKADLFRLYDIWQRWHLNDMRAGCCHQSPIKTNNNPDWDKQAKAETRKCPYGYAYGHAWLVEPLPDDVETYLRQLLNY